MDIGIRFRRQCCTSITPLSVSLLLLLAAAFFLIQLSSASIHYYNREILTDVGNAYLLAGGSEGILAHPHSAARSFIRFENITFWRSKEAARQHFKLGRGSGLVQIVIFEVADRDAIGGSAYGGQRSICCTPDLAKLEGCDQGRVIRLRSSTEDKWPVVLDVRFRGKSLSARMGNREVRIPKTGMYNLFFISCDPTLKRVAISGRTLWKNSNGYLPGRMAPLMKFYGYMSLAYVLLCFIWFFQYLRFRNEILQLQHCITAVVILGWLEMTLWYFEYANFSDTGVRPVALTICIVTVGAVRRTVSRLLILSVSMGYGVVRPTLGGLTSKVLLIGMTYFLATELLDIFEFVGTINDISGKARLLLVLPDALLDAFLILWIFTSLSQTLEHLQAKRSAVKLDIYRKFSNALAVSVIASVAWIAYEVYFKATDPFNERWQNAWIITAFWDILAFVLLCIICYLWAPSQNSQRYAYSDRIGEEFDSDEAQALTKGDTGNLSLVELVKHNNNDNNNSHAYDLEDDDDEADKGE